MAVANCIFCDHRLAPAAQNKLHSRTAEHIFANWFRRLSGHRVMNMYVSDLDGAAAQLNRRAPLNNLATKGVCRKCNNGWMSTLETSVEPILKRVFAGVDVDELDDGDLKTLAVWTAKTAVTLSYATPSKAHVPLQASHSLHPDRRGPVHFGFFYAKITADRDLENGHLQVVYGTEIGLIGTSQVPGTRLVFCLNGHCLLVDFPPSTAAFNFDLTRSCSAQLWPVRRPAGTRNLALPTPARIDQVLIALCKGISVQIDTTALHV